MYIDKVIIKKYLLKTRININLRVLNIQSFLRSLQKCQTRYDPVVPSSHIVRSD